MPGTGLPMEPGCTSQARKLAIMMPPVSVCHQLSWIVRPSSCRPHTTASGLSGSPTLATKRSADRSTPACAAGPAFMSMRMAVGAVYQTLTACSASVVYQRRASNSPSSTIIVTPWVSGAMTP